MWVSPGCLWRAMFYHWGKMELWYSKRDESGWLWLWITDGIGDLAVLQKTSASLPRVTQWCMAPRPGFNLELHWCLCGIYMLSLALRPLVGRLIGYCKSFLMWWVAEEFRNRWAYESMSYRGNGTNGDALRAGLCARGWLVSCVGRKHENPLF